MINFEKNKDCKTSCDHEIAPKFNKKVTPSMRGGKLEKKIEKK